MQNEKMLTKFSQQHQNTEQEVDQILLEKESPIKPSEQVLLAANTYCPPTSNVSITGIKDFDELLDGGFTKGSIILLAGSSGSGKTIFSFQWLFEGIKHNENGIYITLTEPLFKTLENLEKLSYYNKDAVENEKLRIIDLREIYGKEGFDQRKILDFIGEEVKRTNAKRVCIDSITAIAYQIDDRAKIRAFIFALGTTLATLGCTTILISEIAEMNKYSKYEVEEFISDAILRFDQIKVKDEPQRIIQIIKVRGRNFRSDDIQFKISKDGINVFPKLRVPLEHFSSTDRISIGISALDEMLGGGIFVGSSTLITGSPGTGKSTLGLSFIADGLKNGEICLYAGFEESKKQVLRNAKNFGWDFEQYEREGLLIMRCIYPNEKHLEEHLAEIKQIVEGKKIRRCVVDPLSAISNAFSVEEFMSFSKRLNGYLKTREVTPLFTSATTSLISNSKDVDSNLSTISDNIILLRYVEMQGNVQSVINVIKMRGSEHSKNLRLYDITDKGIVVGKSLEGYEGVTTGVSKKIAELEKESKELKEIIKQKETAENALQESEEKFRRISSAALDAIIMIDSQGCVSFWNESAKRIFGYSTEEISGKNFHTILVPNQYLDAFMKGFIHFQKTGEGPGLNKTIEMEGLRKDGTKFPLDLSVSPVQIRGQLHAVGIIRDITERKHAEDILKESEERHRVLFDSSRDAMMFLEPPSWNFTTGNPATVKMFKARNVEEFISCGPGDLSPEYQPDGRTSAEKAKEMIETAMREGSHFFEWIHKRLDGTSFSTTVLLNRMEIKGRRFLQATVRDITEQKQVETEREKMLLWQQGVNILQQSLLLPGAFEDKLKMITDEVVHLFDADFCRIWLVQSGDLCDQGCIHAEVHEGPHVCRYRDRCLHLLASSGRYTHTDGKIHHRVPLGCYKIGRIASGEEHKFITNDVQNDSRIHNNEWARELGLVSFVGYQIRFSNEEPLGVLALFSKHPIIPVEETMLDEISNTVARVIQRDFAEQRFKESKDRYLALYDRSMDAIYIHDFQGNFIDANPAALHMFGYTKDEVVKLNFASLILNEDELRKTYETTSELKKTGSQKMISEYKLRRKDGETIIVETQASVIYKDNKPYLIQGVAREITERKKIETALRERMKEQTCIYAVNSDMKENLSVDELCQRTIEHLKSAMQFPEITVPVIELDGRRFTSEMFTEGLLYSLHAEIIVRGEARGQLWVYYVEDKLFWIPEEQNMLNSIAKALGLWLEHKQGEEKIKHQNIQLEKLNQIKSDFLDVTTREIRSPLTTIKAYTQMLSNQLVGEITDEQKKYLEIMLRNANRLDDLVSGLLDISHIEAGEMIFTPKKTIVGTIVNQAVEKMQPSVKVKNIAINVEMEDEIPDLIVDPERIKQVILNILENAIKFSPDKSTVILRVKKQETDILFEIQDSGKGISKDKQKKIFNAFYRSDEGKSREYSGGGIGLALSRSIVTVHGGKMWVESKDGKGSIFRFTLPIKPVDNIQTKFRDVDLFGLKQDENTEEIK